MRFLDVSVLSSSAGFLRVGIVVPKYGTTAVRRNRLKRRLRELSRIRLLPLPHSFDVIIRARPDAYKAAFDRLRDDIDRLPTHLAGDA